MECIGHFWSQEAMFVSTYAAVGPAARTDYLVKEFTEGARVCQFMKLASPSSPPDRVPRKSV